LHRLNYIRLLLSKCRVGTGWLVVMHPYSFGGMRCRWNGSRVSSEQGGGPVVRRCLSFTRVAAERVSRSLSSSGGGNWGERRGASDAPTSCRQPPVGGPAIAHCRSTAEQHRCLSPAAGVVIVAPIIFAVNSKFRSTNTDRRRRRNCCDVTTDSQQRNR